MCLAMILLSFSIANIAVELMTPAADVRSQSMNMNFKSGILMPGKIFF